MTNHKERQTKVTVFPYIAGGDVKEKVGDGGDGGDDFKYFRQSEVIKRGTAYFRGNTAFVNCK